MKEEIYKCDRCNKEWDLKYNPSAYTLSHISLTGSPIMGDNRVSATKHFCDDCFDIIYNLLQESIKN